MPYGVAVGVITNFSRNFGKNSEMLFFRKKLTTLSMNDG